MRGLWRWIAAHPLATALFLILWGVAWVVTVLTWQRDAAGFSVGMNPLAIPLHVVLPFALGVLVRLARRGGVHGSWKACALAGLAFAVLEFAVLCLVDGLWLPATEIEPPFAELAVGTLMGLALYAAACVLLSILGGKAGSVLTRERDDRGGGA